MKSSICWLAQSMLFFYLDKGTGQITLFIDIDLAYFKPDVT